jgi:type I restriction enzyme S subunit
MSNKTAAMATILGDIAFESKVRAESLSDSGLRVYGVSRNEGLTPEAKYTSKDLGRYKVLRPGMFVYNPMRLNIGSIAYCTAKDPVGLVSPDYVVFGCKPDKLDPNFFRYVIKGSEWRQWTTAAGVGSVRVRIYFRELAKMPITLPPLSEQKAIAQVLGTLDDKIELNRRMNATLESMARALFQSWFVNFDPIRTKLDDCPPVGLDKTTAALFPAHFQESPIGLIPKGWTADTLKDRAANIQYGFTQNASDKPIGPNFLRITDIRGGEIDWRSIPFCEADEKNFKKYRIMDGDIFVARTGASTGDNIYVIDPPPAVFASYLVRLQFESRGIGRLVAEYMQSTDYANHVAGILGGSAQPNASAQMLAGASLAFPQKRSLTHIIV